MKALLKRDLNMVIMNSKVIPAARDIHKDATCFNKANNHIPLHNKSPIQLKLQYYTNG